MEVIMTFKWLCVLRYCAFSVVVDIKSKLLASILH